LIAMEGQASSPGPRRLALRILATAPLALLTVLAVASPTLRVAMSHGWRALRAGDLEALRTVGVECGGAAALFTTLLMIAQALAAPVPAIAVTATNSLLFGPFVGGLLSIASATLAALLCYALARAFGEPIVAHFVSAQKLERLHRFTAAHGASSVLAARLLPFVPFDPISYLAGLARMPVWSFLWATFLGQVPAGFAYSYAAQTLGDPTRMVWAAVLCAALLGGLAWFALRALRRPVDASK
jgi:uncharacterized membrane protein YdjX (TVP38/TMEM64 family)